VIKKIKERIRWVKSIDCLVGLTLFFVPIFFFYDLLSGRYILSERDLGPYFIPPRFFWVESIKSGHFPLWNPYQFSGHPFFANPQHAILYPLNTLFYLFPFDIAFNAVIILHFFLGGLFTYLLLKDLKTNTPAALISGLIFMLSGYLLSVHSLLNTLLSVIWTPLIILYFRRAISSPGWRNEILTAIFIAISFLGGGIEVVYGNFFILLFMVIFFSTHEENQRKWQWKKVWLRVRSLLFISVLFSLLSAVQLLPFLELYHHSIRGSGISYQEATTWSFAPKEIFLFFLPDAYGYFLDMKKYWINQCWFKTLYTGGLPFILSLIFFLAPLPQRGEEIKEGPPSPSGERNGIRGFGKNRKFYVSLILFSIFLSLGKFNPLYIYLYKYVPFFNGLRYPVKFLYIFILVLSITAGLGFQRLIEFSKEGEGKRFKNILIISSLVFGLSLLFLVINHNGIEQFLKLRRIDFPNFNHLPVNLYHSKRFFFYLALFFLLLRIGGGIRWKSWAKILLIFFLTADLFGNMGFYGKEKTSDFFKKTKILEMISSDKGQFRIFSTAKTIAFDTPILIAGASYLDILKEKSLPSLNLIHRLHDIWGIDVIHLNRADGLYKAFTNTSSISTTNFLDLYGVKYIISVTPLGKDPRLKLIYARLEGLQGKKRDLLKENTIKLYKYRNVLSRGFFVKDFSIMKDPKEILSAMNKKTFDPRKKVFLEEEPKWTAVENHSYKDRRLPKNVEFISESNNRLQLFVRAKEKGFFVLSDTYFPGWKVFINGKEGKIYRANYNFRAIPLNAGEYEIQFIYNPIVFKVGILISLLTLFGIVAYFVRRKNPKLKI
jgi:hypothetical protein